MRSLFVSLAVFCAVVSAGDLRLENSRYETVAYIREDGRIEDASFQLLGYIRTESEEESGPGLRIEAGDFRVLGYIRENEVQSPDLRKLFDITSDGRIRDSRLRNSGSIREDGTVEGSDFRVILYTDGAHEELRPRIMAYLVFFSTLLE
ncbi:MAG: hypothetical protein R6V62_08835 [Candidatus Fermentibacteraceae bacterium]